MLYYTNHHLNFVKAPAQMGIHAFSRCPYCQDELPNCDCGYGSVTAQKRTSGRRPSRRRMGRKRPF